MLRSARTMVLLAALLGACSGGGLPRPPTGPQSPEAFLPVPDPAPAPRAQKVPDRPSADAVWVDGEWVPAGPRWQWQTGGWVVPPAGARLALHESRRQPDGSLKHAPSLFHLPDGSTRTVASLLGLSTARSMAQPFCAGSGSAAGSATPPVGSVSCL